MSPHITIYKFELPALMSISHRATGMILASYAAMLGFGRFNIYSDICIFNYLTISIERDENFSFLFAGTLLAPGGVAGMIASIDAMCLPMPVLFLAKYILVLPATYHYFNGIRHLVKSARYGIECFPFLYKA